MMFMLWVSDRPVVYGGEGVSDIYGIVGKQFDSVQEWDPIPTDGIPLLSGFILTAEWSITHVTFSAYRAFCNCLKPAHKPWGRTRLACGLTEGLTDIAANPRIRARTRALCAPRADDFSISNQWLGSKLIHSQVGKYHEKHFQRLAQPP